MTIQKYDRINSLKSMAKNKSANTSLKVKKAITEMENNNIKLTFQAVAKVAKVSKTWLYNNKEVAEYIRKKRSQSPVKKIVDHMSMLIIDKKDKEIDFLRKRVGKMVSEIDSLKNQLEAVYAELYKVSSYRHGCV